jgi:putative transposase
MTFSCADRRPMFSREKCCVWMLDALTLGREKVYYELWAYVIMPEHVHLVLYPHSNVKISEILKCIKQSVSKRAFRWLEENDPQYLVRNANASLASRSSFNFWQRGGGYDRNLRSVADIHEKVNYVHNNPVRRGLVSRPSRWPMVQCTRLGNRTGRADCHRSVVRTATGGKWIVILASQHAHEA